MAIVLLASGVGSVANGTPAVPNSTSTVSIAVPAGSNRLLLVCVTLKARDPVAGVVAPAETLPIVTYNGVQLSVITRDIDGSSESFRTISSGNLRIGVFWFIMRESELAALPGGALDLIASYSTGAQDWGFRPAYWFLSNCDQGSRIRDYSRASTTASVTNLAIAPPFGSGGASDAVLIGSVNNQITGTIEHTVNGAAQTETTINSNNGAKHSTSHTLSLSPAAPVPVDMTFTAGAVAATVLLPIRVAEFFSPTPGARCVAYDSTVQTVSVVSS